MRFSDIASRPIIGQVRSQRAVDRVKAELRRKGTLTPLTEEYLDAQAVGMLPEVDLPANASDEVIGKYLDRLDRMKHKEQIYQTVRRIRNDSLGIGPGGTLNDPRLAPYFDDPKEKQSVPRVGSEGELELEAADGRGGGAHGYVHLRPGTKRFTKKYIPDGEEVIEQIRTGHGERLEKVYVSGKTGKPLRRKPKRLPR